MKLFLKSVIVVICIAFTITMFSLQTIVAAQNNMESIETDGVILSNQEKQALDLINIERQKVGLKPLVEDIRLQEIAREKALDIETNDYFSHNSNKYGSAFDMMKSQAIAYKIAGENLARGPKIDKTVDAWMDSESHRRNILEADYEYTGIAVVKSEKYGYIVVQMFTQR